MDDFQNDSAEVNPGSLHMNADSDVLATWSETAGQSHRNAVYGTLFALLDGTLHRTHEIIEAAGNQVFVPLKDDLVLKIRFGDDSFDIVHIGRWADAPGFDLTLDQLN